VTRSVVRYLVYRLAHLMMYSRNGAFNGEKLSTFDGFKLYPLDKDLMYLMVYNVTRLMVRYLVLLIELHLNHLMV